ncbi:disintegrin and metalloproteinase domain-containing protein 30 [Acomys russatus]|uniref:disintegrin and metalloproteinase domain-containing protein 30 n=1 Tax=Acomys russatus TaxID=60746 RepID=UPI0021E1F2E2|nr:disintegrin and metalloproteinase domain-containing protein 30 [Acomys russatus]
MRSGQRELPQHPWLLLALLFLEAVGDDLLFDPDWGFDSYEITIPKKLSFRRGEVGVDNTLSYLLQIEGKEHIIRLQPKKLLLPRHLPVFSFSQEGSRLEDYPYIPKECNYVGYVDGSQDSESTLSTCMGGLRGILSIDSRYYQIEPLLASSTFEHVVYLLSEDDLSNQTCGRVDEEAGGQTTQEEEMPRISSFHQSYMHQKYLELFMIFDAQRVYLLNGNLSMVTNDAILLTAIIDTYFQDVRVRIHLNLVEAWTTHNRIRVHYDELSEALGQFILYKAGTLDSKYHFDWVHLYIAKRYIDALAWSWGRVCGVFSGSASTFLNKNVLGPATWTAHELGHSVGMLHDDEFCQCRGRKNCIMGTGRTGFSNCSYNYFVSSVYHTTSRCLANLPGQVYMVKRCGNKIVEDKEECDCGSKEDCQKDLCCGPDCKWREGVNCSTGLCCHKCNFLPSGHLCRQEENECDLAEYCDGLSGFCPEDTYKQDGTPCKYKGVCFRKGCRSRYMQCQAIFGPSAREAPQQCYDAVNMVGDQYGHCGIINFTRFQRCSRSSTICGRLQCINVKTIPNLPDHTIILSTYLKADNLMCWGTGYHGDMITNGVHDIGMVTDGTHCGPNRVCVNSTCIDSTILNFDCLPDKCNNRGFCNNKKNCHCMYGWQPPFCEEVGFGGSIDSGPPGLKTEDMPLPVRVVYVILLRVILFIVSVIVVFFRQLIKKWFLSHSIIGASICTCASVHLLHDPL